MFDLISKTINVLLILCGLVLLTSCIMHPSFERSTTGLLMLLFAKD